MKLVVVGCSNCPFDTLTQYSNEVSCSHPFAGCLDITKYTLYTRVGAPAECPLRNEELVLELKEEV